MKNKPTASGPKSYEKSDENFKKKQLSSIKHAKFITGEGTWITQKSARKILIHTYPFCAE